MTRDYKILAPFKPLQYPAYRMLWTTASLSLLGFWMHRVGAAWIMSSMTHSPIMTSLLEASLFLPAIFFSIPAGVIADKINRSGYLACLISVMMTLSLILSILVATKMITPALLIFISILLGTGSALRNPALVAEMGTMVPSDQFESAATLDNISFNLARIVGPSIGGVLISLVGPFILFLLNAFSSLGVILVFYKRYAENKKSTPKVLTTKTVQPAKLLETLKNRYFCLILLRSFIFFACSNILWAFLPLIIQADFKANSVIYGFLFAAFGIGSIVGGFALSYMREFMSASKVISMAGIAYTIMLIIVGCNHQLWLLMSVLFLGGAALLLITSIMTSQVMMIFPNELRGRALALYFLTQNGSIAIGSPIFGLLAAAFSIKIAMLCAALLVLSGALLGFTQATYQNNEPVSEI